MAKRAAIVVLTVRMSDMKETDERVIDHSNPKDRSWLTSHTHWAVRNGHGIQMSPFDKRKDSK